MWLLCPIKLKRESQRNQRSNCQHSLKLPTFTETFIEKAREIQKNIYLCFINYTKAFHYVDCDKLRKALKEMRIPDHLTCLLRNLYVGQKQQWEPCMEQLIGSRLRKEKDRAVCCHPSCLIYMLSASWEMPGKLQAGINISRRNINNLVYVDDITLMAENKEELKSLLMRVKEENGRASLKIILKKLRSWHLAPLLHGK